MKVFLHNPTSAKAHDTKGANCLDLIDADGNCVTVFMPYHVAAALAAAWTRATAGEATAHRAREMNAELPEADRDVLKAKGMV